MFRFRRIALAALAALGLLAATAQPAQAGPVWVDAQLDYSFPSPESPGAWSAYLLIAIEIEPGWYYSGMSFTELADRAGHTLSWWYVPWSPLQEQLMELSASNLGGSAIGFLGGVSVDAKTPPGFYDRDPSNLRLPAMLTVYATNDAGETASDSVGVSLRVPGAIVPEPASALLLGAGLAVTAGAARGRRRRTV